MIAVRHRPLARRLTPYLAFARTAFVRESTYRIDVFTSVASLVVRVYLLRTVWFALYAQNAAPSGIPLHAIVTYTTVALLMSLVLEVDGTRLIRDKMRDGTIATDLMKPISLPVYFFSEGFGQTCFHALTIVPALILALFIVHVDLPAPSVLAAFALSFVLGYCVNFLLNFIMNSVAFWTLETFAIQLIVRWISDLLGGQIVPLVFFPAGPLQQFVLALPFAAIYSTPLLIYVGTIPPAHYAQAMALQVLWLVVFGAFGALIWRAGEKRIVVQGG